MRFRLPGDEGSKLMARKKQTASFCVAGGWPLAQKRRRLPVSHGCDYEGWLPEPETVIGKHPVENMPPESFWREYVAQRRPIVLLGQLQDTDWRAAKAWSDKYLIETAGDAEVTVEQRAGTQDSFGKGNKKRMRFGEFVRQAAAGNDSLYLTTQQVMTDAEGHPEVMAAPLEQLRADFPLVPELLGNLVPQQINFWMGCAPNGLHHDYHDNLYILLRGRKRFRLWSPADVDDMATFGKLSRVHANGRIVYQEQGAIRADGSHWSDVKGWKAASKANRLSGDVTVSQADGEDNEDAALEAALEQATAQGSNSSSDSMECWSDGNLRDDYVDSDAVSGGEGKQPEREPDPPSFSRIDLSLDDAQIKAEHPDFPGKASALEFELNAGEMLYLPCGWFHEVTSFTDTDSSTHLALNYWVHPPDYLQPEGFLKPYSKDYWPSLWRKRLKKMKVEQSPRNESTGRRKKKLQQEGEEPAAIVAE